MFNAAARLIHRSSRYERIPTMLRDLHWLRAPERVDFKLAMLVYRCLHGQAPQYLSNYSQHVTMYANAAILGRRDPRS